jgi:dihydrofolate reductase
MEKKLKLSIIVAIGENGVIGKGNDLPWSRLPKDMKYFMETTMGKPIVTGRKNYESIPKDKRPLVGRENILLSRDKDFIAPGAIVVDSVDVAIKKIDELDYEEAFIIGGGEIYRQTLHLVDRLYITRVHESFGGDVFFPQINEDEWFEVSKEFVPADEKNKYATTRFVLERR